MLLDHKRLKTFLKSFDRSNILYIQANKNIHGICSLYILTAILKKDLIKFQIDFENMDSSTSLILSCDIDALKKVSLKDIENSDNLFFLSNILEGCCCCTNRDTVSVSVLLKLLKSLDFIRIETIWPVAVAFTYYKKFLNTNSCRINSFQQESKTSNEIGAIKNSENPNNLQINRGIIPLSDKENKSNLESSKNHKIDTEEVIKNSKLCAYCVDLGNDIDVSIKMLNCKFEGVFVMKKVSLDFLSNSSLMQSLKNDIQFIHDKKLFYSKSKSNDLKIGEYLAKKGISLQAAFDPFESIGHFTKKLIETSIGTNEKYIFKNGHDLEISSIEHALLALFYLYKDTPMYSFMCLNKRKLIDTEKACKFYDKIITVFKDAVVSASKVEDLIIFKIRKGSISSFTPLADLFDRLFKIYLEFRSEDFNKIIINYQVDEKESILYSNDVKFNKKNSLNKENIGLINEESYVGILRISSDKLNNVIKEILKENH